MLIYRPFAIKGTFVVFNIGEWYHNGNNNNNNKRKRYLFAYNVRLKVENKTETMQNRPYLRGTVVVAPKQVNNSDGDCMKDIQNYGWIHCQHQNAMYRMRPSQHRFDQNDIVFFKPIR